MRYGNIYYCDHIGCDEIGRGSDWKMCEIVFGIDPKVINERNKEGKGIIVVQARFNFCKAHEFFYQEILFALIVQAESILPELIIGEASFKEGFGCWITIHNCLTRDPIKNFQMPYELFEKVYTGFPTKGRYYCNDSSIERIRQLRTLECSVKL